ncbi:lysylphosphatidylglycerol synthase transmembrane domain-containing protein [Qipengyuania zhejiangensis]|uniref:lysylphosphatidylglycerol synthase transmembrane domain-containing protein n=1 Tax=Qipengyuania zhejiangensis TaxID=3077782 RepID=UPI002D7A2E9E|nr:lysylphosphatidylglycerol synthase transmembrane domain-containing protein [Qipengyuania sp. Z2]
MTPEGQGQNAPVKGSRFSRRLAIALAIAGAVFAVMHFGDLEHFLALLRQAEPIWLLVAIALQFGTYASVAYGWKSVLKRAASPRPLIQLLPIAVSKLFADQAIPSAGIGGHVLLIDRLTSLGVPRSAAAATLIISLLGYYVAYAVLAVVMLVVLWLHKDATPLLVGLVTAFLLVALAIPLLALWLRNRGSKPLPPRIERFTPIAKLLTVIGEAPAELVRDHGLLGRVAVCNAAVFLADSMTLAIIFMALGMPFEPGTAFLALMAGSISATLSPIPMGLGSFEAAAVAMLVSLGVAFEGGLTAVLLLRGLTLWLPLIPSFFLLRKGMHASNGRDGRGRA